MDLNDKAPAFTVPDEEGKPVSLKNFLGKPIVLFFFPKADTPG
jgi:thioredoxin-dependent peroxiredoxin